MARCWLAAVTLAIVWMGAATGPHARAAATTTTTMRVSRTRMWDAGRYPQCAFYMNQAGNVKLANTTVVDRALKMEDGFYSTRFTVTGGDVVSVVVSGTATMRACFNPTGYDVNALTCDAGWIALFVVGVPYAGGTWWDPIVLLNVTGSGPALKTMPPREIPTTTLPISSNGIFFFGLLGSDCSHHANYWSVIDALTLDLYGLASTWSSAPSVSPTRRPTSKSPSSAPTRLPTTASPTPRPVTLAPSAAASKATPASVAVAAGVSVSLVLVFALGGAAFVLVRRRRRHRCPWGPERVPVAAEVVANDDGDGSFVPMAVVAKQ